MTLIGGYIAILPIMSFLCVFHKVASQSRAKLQWLPAVFNVNMQQPSLDKDLRSAPPAALPENPNQGPCQCCEAPKAWRLQRVIRMRLIAGQKRKRSRPT